MGNDKESQQKETLDELAGHADSTHQLPLSLKEHIDLLKKEYNLSALIRENAITKDDILFLAVMRCEIDSYSYAAGISEISPEAVVGASVTIDTKYAEYARKVMESKNFKEHEKRYTGIYVRQLYEELTSIIHMCKKPKT
jgi:hypothetical protein